VVKHAEKVNKGMTKNQLKLLWEKEPSNEKQAKAKDFWKNVAPVQNKMPGAKGLLFSVGIGEMPFLRQATFSVWQDENDMRSFAYTMAEHRDVIKKTRDRKWYSEEMFTRFRPLAWCGKLNGKSPLNG
jgi:hypothetical protein